MNEEMVTLPKRVYESEKKMRFFGTDYTEVYQKKFDIFIGISISNKKITPEIALNYVQWAVNNTKRKVAVIIADELNIVNYEIFDGYSSGKAKNRAKKVGEVFNRIFSKAIKKLPMKDQSKITIHHWPEVRANKNYMQIREFLEDRYYEDLEFKSAILYFVRKYMMKKRKIITNQKKNRSISHLYIRRTAYLIGGDNFERYTL